MLVSSGLALVFLPGARAVALVGWRKGRRRLVDWVQRVGQGGRAGLSRAGVGQRVLASGLGWLLRHARWVLGALVVLTALPLVAMAWRHWVAIDTFDHTDVRIRDERVAALLAGERLVPPPELPPPTLTYKVTQEL